MSAQQPAGPAPQSYLEWLHVTAAQTPHRIALVDRSGSMTYGKLSTTIRAVAAGARARGLAAGQPVGIAMDPSSAYVALALGLMQSGAVPAFLNTKLAPPEAAAYITTIDPQLVIHAPEHAALVEKCDRARLELGDLGALLGDDALAPGVPAADEPALIFPTGGTTGLPKGCWTSHRQLLLWIWNIATTNQRHRDETELFVAPFFHVSLVVGVFAPLFARGTVVIEPSFDPASAIELITRHEVTRLMGAPTVLTSLIAAAGGDHSAFLGVRDIGFGAASWTDSFCDQLTSAFPNAAITAGYGATEFASGVSRISPADFRAGRYDGAGIPNPGCEIAVFGPGGERLGAGVQGEIGVRSPWQTLGYWNQPAETAATYGTDGFIRLGDVGHLTHDGWLHISGRLKEMVITGGENVFPLEVEQALTRADGVAQAVAFGVPDDHWGERVEAAVVLQDGATLDATATRAWLKTQLAGYKVPKRIHVLGALPLTPNGKPDRRRLISTCGRQR